MTPVNRRRERLKGLVQRELLRRTDRDDVWERSPELRAARAARHGRSQQPIRLVDRLLPGPSGQATQRGPSPISSWSTRPTRCSTARRSRSASGRRRSAGPLGGRAAGHRPAQPARVDDDPRRPGAVDHSGRPTGLERRAARTSAPTAAEVACLTIGYRVPGPILDVANRLLPYTDVVERAQPQRAAGGHGPRRARRAVVPASSTPCADRGARRCGTVTTTPVSSRPSRCCTTRSPTALAATGAASVDHVHDLATTTCRSSPPRP